MYVQNRHDSPSSH